MAKSRSGLKKVSKSVRSKSGKSVKRSYWVKAGERNMAAFRKGPKMASAKMGAKIGLVTGLLGVHRVHGAYMGSTVGAHALAMHMRKKTGTQGRTFGGKLKNALATDVGHGLGHAVGAVAHEGIRRALGRKSAFGGRGGTG